MMNNHQLTMKIMLAVFLLSCCQFFIGEAYFQWGPWGPGKCDMRSAYDYNKKFCAPSVAPEVNPLLQRTFALALPFYEGACSLTGQSSNPVAAYNTETYSDASYNCLAAMYFVNGLLYLKNEYGEAIPYGHVGPFWMRRRKYTWDQDAWRTVENMPGFIKFAIGYDKKWKVHFQFFFPFTDPRWTSRSSLHWTIGASNVNRCRDKKNNNYDYDNCESPETWTNWATLPNYYPGDSAILGPSGRITQAQLTLTHFKFTYDWQPADQALVNVVKTGTGDCQPTVEFVLYESSRFDMYSVAQPWKYAATDRYNMMARPVLLRLSTPMQLDYTRNSLQKVYNFLLSEVGWREGQITFLKNWQNKNNEVDDLFDIGTSAGAQVIDDFKYFDEWTPQTGVQLAFTICKCNPLIGATARWQGCHEWILRQVDVTDRG